MKKTLILAATILAISFTSCGGSEENKEGENKAMSVCDCMKASEEMMGEVEKAGGDDTKMKEIEEKYKSKMEECKKMGEGKSEEEMKALMEEAKNC